MKKTDQRGLTLVELLAVIALSSIILAVGYSILFSTIKSADHSAVQTKLRNESVLITQQFNQAMLNVDSIEIVGEQNANGKFTSFQAIDKAATADASNQGQDVIVPVEITNDGNLLINNKQINSVGYSLKNTTFRQINGNLQVYYAIDDLNNHARFTLLKIYNLQGE